MRRCLKSAFCSARVRAITTDEHRLLATSTTTPPCHHPCLSYPPSSSSSAESASSPSNYASIDNILEHGLLPHLISLLTSQRQAIQVRLSYRNGVGALTDFASLCHFLIASLAGSVP